MKDGQLKKIRKWIRLVLLIIPIIIFLWLVNKNLVPSGRLEASYNFQELSPFISRLYPVGRVLGIEQDKKGDYYQSIVIDPVYFDIHLPVSFQKAKIILKYQVNNVYFIRLGYQTGSNFQYFFKNVITSGREGEWQVAEVDFDLRGAYIKDNKLKFAISSPHLDEQEGKIKVHSIEVFLEKESLTFRDIPSLAKKFIKKIF